MTGASFWSDPIWLTLTQLNWLFPYTNCLINLTWWWMSFVRWCLQTFWQDFLTLLRITFIWWSGFRCSSSALLGSCQQILIRFRSREGPVRPDWIRSRTIVSDSDQGKGLSDQIGSDQERLYQIRIKGRACQTRLDQIKKDCIRFRSREGPVRPDWIRSRTIVSDSDQGKGLSDQIGSDQERLYQIRIKGRACQTRLDQIKKDCIRFRSREGPVKPDWIRSRKIVSDSDQGKGLSDQIGSDQERLYQIQIKGRACQTRLDQIKKDCIRFRSREGPVRPDWIRSRKIVSDWDQGKGLSDQIGSDQERLYQIRIKGRACQTRLDQIKKDCIRFGSREGPVRPDWIRSRKIVSDWDQGKGLSGSDQI